MAGAREPGLARVRGPVPDRSQANSADQANSAGQPNSAEQPMNWSRR